MHQISASAAVLLLSVGLWLTTAKAEILYSDNFDGYSPGSLPTGWTRLANAATDPGNNAVSTATAYSAPNSFQVYGDHSQSCWAAHMTYSVDLASKSGVVTLHGRFMCSGDIETSKSCHEGELAFGFLSLAGDPGKECGTCGQIMVVRGRNGDGNGLISGGFGSRPLTYGVWHSVSIQLDLRTLKYATWVDSQELGSETPLFTRPTLLTVASGGGRAWVDDVVLEYTPTLNDGLVAYYPFDGTARDASGNGNDGVVNGATLTNDRRGRANCAYAFGRDRWIRVPNSASLQSPVSQVTVSAWTRIDALDGGQRDWGPILCKATSGRWHYCLEVHGTGSGAPWALFLGDGIGIVANPPLELGVWHHLAATCDGASAIAYQDGKEIGRIAHSGPLLVNNHPLDIGRDLPGSAEYMLGAIDEVRIYNRALSAGEILQAYTSAGESTANITLSNVRASQMEGTKTVRVYYDIAGAFQTIPVATMISTDDGQSYDLVGPVEMAVAPGTNRRLDWDASAQLPNQLNEHVRVRVIAGSATADTPQSFTVDTRGAVPPGAVPEVLDVSSRYFRGKGDDGQHVFFLSGVSTYPGGLPFRQEVKVAVDWRGKLPKNIHYLCPEPYDGLESNRTFDIGSWPAGAKLQVIAEAGDGTRSVPFPANFDVIPPPPPLIPQLLYAVPFNLELSERNPDALKYSLAGVNWDLFAPAATPPKEVPGFGDQVLGFISSLEISADVSGDGTAEGGITVPIAEGYTASHKWKVKGIVPNTKTLMGGVEIKPEVSVNPKWKWNADHWDITGSVGFYVNNSVSIPPPPTPPPYICLVPPVYIRGEVEARLGVELEVLGFGGDGKPVLNGVVPFEGIATFIAGCGAAYVAAVECSVGGGPKIKVQFPQQPTLRQLGLHLEGGVKVIFLIWQNDLIRVEHDWWVVKEPDQMLVRHGLAADEDAVRAVSLLNKPTGERFSLMPRAYRASSTPYASFLPIRNRAARLAWEDPVVAQVPLTLQTNIFPYSDPALGVSGTNRMSLLITDNPARSDENRTEVIWSKWNGTAWPNPASVWDDGTADFAPAVKALPGGKALAVWQNERAELPKGAGLEQALAGLEIAVGWFDPVSQTWSCSNLTDNLTLDQGPKLDAAGNGRALVTWVSNAANNPLGSASEPSVIRSRFWDGAAWQDPGDVATDVGMLLWHTVAFDGANGVMLATLDHDDDQGTIADQELCGATFNGTSWSAFVRLTTNSVQDTKPQAAFDSAGHLLVVWYQDTNLVMHAGGLDLANPTVIGAVGGASSAKDFRLITGPDGQVTLLWEDVAEDGTGPDPFVFNYDYALNSWSQPIRLLRNTNLLERSFAGAYSDTGSLLVAYNQVNVRTDANGAPIPLATNQVDLMFLDYAIGGDLAVVPGSLLLSTNNPLPGQSVQLSATVRNAGEKAATNIATAFYSGGTLIGTPPAVPFLAAGASTNVSFDWTIPVGVTDQSISVTVDPDLGREDRNRANNTASLVVLAPDLVVTEMSVMNSARDRRMINARVVNQGNYACASGFQVSFRRGAVDGPEIGSIAVEAVPSGGQYDANLEWNLAGVTFTNAYETVYAVADPGATVVDSDRSNNSSFVQLATTFDSDGDGLADADELRYGADPLKPDTDADGLRDGEEVYRYRTSSVLADSDGDGMKDGDEARAGTDPLNRDDLFAVVLTDVGTGHVHVRWSAKAKQSYQVIRSLDLRSWTEAPSGSTPEQQSRQTAVADGLLEYFEPVAAPNAEVFYRVRLAE